MDFSQIVFIGVVVLLMFLMHRGGIGCGRHHDGSHRHGPRERAEPDAKNRSDIA